MTDSCGEVEDFDEYKECRGKYLNKLKTEKRLIVSFVRELIKEAKSQIRTDCMGKLNGEDVSEFLSCSKTISDRFSGNIGEYKKFLFSAIDQIEQD